LTPRDAGLSSDERSGLGPEARTSDLHRLRASASGAGSQIPIRPEALFHRGGDSRPLRGPTPVTSHARRRLEGGVLGGTAR
jgi:hypothetical protein